LAQEPRIVCVEELLDGIWIATQRAVKKKDSPGVLLTAKDGLPLSLALNILIDVGQGFRK
jgi:hypothetical protein